MILIFNRDDFSIDRFEIKDVDGVVLYHGIYDFSFKNRLRIFDKNDNELAYIQYKVSDSEKMIKLCDIEDKVISYIEQDNTLNNIVVKPDNYVVLGDISDWDYKAVDINEKVILSTNNYEICVDDNSILKCLFIILSMADEKQLLL